MKKLVILGAGTAGTMILNKLEPVLDKDEILIYPIWYLFKERCG